MDKYDKAEIPCLDQAGRSLNADMYGDIKYYGNKIICWMCCMIICGPFFIIMGVSAIGQAAVGTDYRLVRIKDYNTIVDAWNSKEAAAFNDIKFTLKIEDGSTGVGSAVTAGASVATGGMCSGNAATATNFAKASTPAGTFQFDCGAGFHLKTDSATIKAFGSTDALKKEQCCVATVSGQCDGNYATATGLEPHGTARRLAGHLAGTFQFKCTAGKHLKANAAAITGATDALCCDDNVAGKCAGNTKMATGLEKHGARRLAAHLGSKDTYMWKCPVGKHLKANPLTITGNTDNACCDTDVAGKCSGNTLTATNLAEVALAGSLIGTSGTATAPATAGTFQFACGVGFLVKPSSVALTGTTPALMKQACCQNLFGKCSGNEDTAANLRKQAADTTWGYDCGAGFHYKAHGEGIERPGIDNAGDKAACCEADVVGKCAGNTLTATDLAQPSDPAGTFQYKCPSSYRPKFNGVAITGKTTALCCDATANMCDGNSVTATHLEPHGTRRRLAAHLAGTFQFKCGEGYTLKADAEKIQRRGIQAQAKVDCCVPVTTSETDFVKFEPEWVKPDYSVRDKEIFSEVKEKNAYKVALKRNNKVANDAIAMTKMTLSGAGVSNVYEFQSVIKKTVPEIDAKYTWYVSKDTSSTPSITCARPGYDYPGTRYNGKTKCSAWCARKGGTWKESSKCWESQSEKATGCCIVPEKDTHFGLKQISFVASCTSATACTIDATKPSVGGAMNALTAFKNTPYTAAMLDETKVSGSFDKASYPSLIYAEMSNGLTDWKTDAEIQVEIRSDKDPYYAAQAVAMSNKASSFKTGCVTGTHDTPYKDLSTPMGQPEADGKARCFGQTPGEQAGSGMIMIVIGSIILAPICCIFCVIKALGNKRAEKDPTRGWKTPTANPTAAGAPTVVEMIC